MELLFDKSRDYGTITPPLNGAVWYQDERYFNANGYPVNIDTGEVLSIEVEAPKPEPVITYTTTIDATGEMTVEEVVSAPKEVKDPRAELVKWLRAEEGCERNWMTIRGYGKDVLGRVASGKDELISMAIDAEIVPESQIKIG